MNNKFIHIIAFGFSILLGIQIYINIRIYNEKNLIKLSSIVAVSPIIIKDSKIYGFKDVLELSKDNKDIKIVKLGINPEVKTKINVEIEYNGTKDSFNKILELISSKKNICSINNISLTSIDEFKVKALVNMDFIKSN